MKLWSLTFGGLLLSICTALLANAAQARPRDEVMSRAFRCGVIGDSRVWLDCYYGAAQPARAALGLQPAPSLQLKLVLTPPAGTASPGDLTRRDQVLSEAFHCSQWNDDRRWLDCYYAAALPMRSVLGLSGVAQGANLASNAPLPGNAMSAMRPSQTQSSANFSAGLDSQEKGSGGNFGLAPRSQTQARLDHVDTYMVKYTFDKYGIFTATLANGQVWRQISGDTTYAHWNKPPQSYAVHISRGFLGSYNFQVKRNPGLFKVQRVQ